MRKGLLFSVFLMAGLLFAGFSPQSYAAKQKKPIFNDLYNCAGNTVGKITVGKKRYSVIVKTQFTNGQPNTSYEVWWECRVGGTGCRTGSGCGSRRLGLIRTDGSGKGKFRWKGTAPFPGTMYFEILSVQGGTEYCFTGLFAAP